eukprot:TRINITY_DN326_c0_g2_i1.p1 TRINITY_DN326_c0_g2~~TRINITY_DN326_c0_g2_i1.p1  ORF type:complete len:791 (+),score=81.13 TRINITY_DN326_c0_g2_i1:641-3013(+)
MSTIKTLLKPSSTKTPQNTLYSHHLKGIMRPSWHTDKQAQERLIQWKASNTPVNIQIGALYQGQWRKFSIILKIVQAHEQFLLSTKPQTTFMIRASYLQIYNEVIFDLLKADRANLQIREDKRKGVFVEGLSEWAVRSPSDIYSLMKKGEHSRATAATKLNDVSSRSHAVFIIVVEQMRILDGEHGKKYRPESILDDAPKSIKVGKLNLVDLAGSERLSITGATGKRLEECKKINQSLSALGNVIAALTDSRARTHIPYRDSKLTRLLEDSLGGNCKTTMMAMISPAYISISESLSSLKFAHRAKSIKNIAKINEDVDQRALLRKYETELKQLRCELEERNKNVMNKEFLYKLEHDKRKAEEDKAAAINALEAISKEVGHEKEERKRLEDKIKVMSSQVLLGGKKIEDTPQFLFALEERQKVIKEEYEKKLHDLEKEREQIEEDKAEVDRYKQLLLKQRDIMVALTARLNERDETIIQLQEELDAYDRIHKETEDALDIKCARVQLLENTLITHRIPVPPLDEEEKLPERGEMIQRRYAPYQAENGIDPPDTDVSEAPLYLLTADEKIAELMDIIERQKAMLGNVREYSQTEVSAKVEAELAKRTEELEDKFAELEAKEMEIMEQRKELEIAMVSMNEPKRNHIEDNGRIAQIIEKEMLVLANNAVKELKEQKDQYRLYHIVQDISTLQKMLVSLLGEFKYVFITQKLQGKAGKEWHGNVNEIRPIVKFGRTWKKQGQKTGHGCTRQRQHKESSSRLLRQENLNLYFNNKYVELQYAIHGCQVVLLSLLL